MLRFSLSICFCCLLSSAWSRAVAIKWQVAKVELKLERHMWWWKSDSKWKVKGTEIRNVFLLFVYFFFPLNLAQSEANLLQIALDKCQGRGSRERKRQKQKRYEDQRAPKMLMICSCCYCGCCCCWGQLWNAGQVVGPEKQAKVKEAAWHQFSTIMLMLICSLIT